MKTAEEFYELVFIKNNNKLTTINILNFAKEFHK